MSASSLGLLVLVSVLVSSCALRPRYRDLVPATATGAQVKLQLVDGSSGVPLPNVKLELGEGKFRTQATTDAMGFFSLPVDKSYSAENAVLVVTLPREVADYKVVAPPALEGMPFGPAQPRAEPPQPVAAPVADAGVVP